jgi:predicted TIM-barrel fold metal-dependent hydrolase
MPIHPLNFLDINCGIGSYFNPPRGHDPSPEALLRRMDELGIAEAAVYHFHAQQYDYFEGNATLIDAISEHPRLSPVPMVGPHYTREAMAPDETVEFMRSHDARIVKMFFGNQPLVPGPDPFLLEPLLDELARKRAVLLLEYADHLTIDFDKLRALLGGWPGLSMVLVFPRTEYHDRYFYALFERFDNFLIELAGNQFMDGIETIVERFGPERIVYGSRYPYFTPLQSMLQVIYADVDEDTKRKIAGDNVRALLDRVVL